MTIRQILDDHERELWYLTGATMVGDVVTTWYGTTHTSLSEGNPLVLHIADYIGLMPAVVLLKLIVVMILYVFYIVSDEDTYHIPTAFVFITGLVMLSNTLLILHETFM